MARALLSLVASLFLAVSSGCQTNVSPEAQIEDDGIATTIKGKLAAELNLNAAANVSVNLANGIVTLSGRVKNFASKRRAEAIARSVDGVLCVNNDLQMQANP